MFEDVLDTICCFTVPCLSQVKAILDEILEKLPESFNMVEIIAKAEEKTPFIIVVFQECERMNILTKEISRSLKDLNLGFKVCIQHILASRL